LACFAGTGVGKSVLLGMMTRFTEADIIVVGLIGERGREVKEFIENILTEESIKRSVVVASPADDAPLMRLRAAMYCTRIAEYFRDKGKNVLLLMDSLTRFAQAQREIALAIGEPPATKGYPPSVFAKLPKPGGARRQCGRGRWLDHGVLHRPVRGRRPARPDRRRGARGAGRPFCAVSPVGGGGALPRHRHRGLDQPGHAAGGQRRAYAQCPALQAALVALSAKPRSDQRRRLCAGGDPETDLAIARQAEMVRYLRQGLNEAEHLAQSEALLASVFNPKAAG
jgi:flagellum-specific ATP synthase